MSDERDRPLSIDPFLGDDPEAIARERRRQQREARRRARSENRKSLGERVSGALDDADRRLAYYREVLDRAMVAANLSAPPCGTQTSRPACVPPPNAASVLCTTSTSEAPSRCHD